MLNLSHHQKAQFTGAGYLVLPKLLTGDFVHTARQAILIHKSIPGQNMSTQLQSDPMITDLYEDSVLCAYPEILLGDWNSQRSPNTSITSLSPTLLDENDVSKLTPELDETRCALHATVILTNQRSPESGNLVVWKGSHQNPVETCQGKALICNAGDVILHHGKLFHAFERNHSTDVQMMVTFKIHHKDHLATSASPTDPFSGWLGLRTLEMAA